MQRKCFICGNEHWMGGRLHPPVPGGICIYPEHRERELEHLLWRSLRRGPKIEKTSANGSKPEATE